MTQINILRGESKVKNVQISVIVAAYNIENYIEKCLESLINQTLKELEVIVINDGSQDRTPLKIEKYSKKDERVILINQENKGLIEARKTGLNIAKGEYILFVDGDDWLELNALEVLYENAIKNNSDIVLYQAFKSYDNEKELFSIYDKCKEASLEEILLGKILPAIWSKFIKLDYIKLNNIPFPSNISFAEDLATVTSLFIFNPKVSIIDIPLYNYYQRSNSITKQIDAKVLEIDEAFNFIKKTLQTHEIYLENKDKFEYLVYIHMFDNWFLKYADLEQKYILDLYKKYKNYEVDINSNSYIREKISNYSLSLKMRVYAYNQSYKLGKFYDYIRRIFKRGE